MAPVERYWLYAGTRRNAPIVSRRSRGYCDQSWRLGMAATATTNSEASIRRRRVTAITVAALLLFAQTLAAAHYHNAPDTERLSRSVQLVDNVCAICLFHFHAPTNPGPPPSLPEPAISERRPASILAAPITRIAASDKSSRAPPASA